MAKKKQEQINQVIDKWIEKNYEIGGRISRNLEGVLNGKIIEVCALCKGSICWDGRLKKLREDINKIFAKRGN